MADIQDYLAAARETDDAVRSMDSYAARFEDGGRTPQGVIALAICLAGRSIALAIREASTRADYVTRDEARR